MTEREAREKRAYIQADMDSADALSAKDAEAMLRRLGDSQVGRETPEWASIRGDAGALRARVKWLLRQELEKIPDPDAPKPAERAPLPPRRREPTPVPRQAEPAKKPGLALVWVILMMIALAMPSACFIFGWWPFNAPEFKAAKAAAKTEKATTEAKPAAPAQAEKPEAENILPKAPKTPGDATSKAGAEKTPARRSRLVDRIKR